jgi:signal transduction histidine kinase
MKPTFTQPIARSPVYIIAMFAVCFISAVLMWRANAEGWTLLVFGMAWVGMVVAFSFEGLSRTRHLEQMVKHRTTAIEAANLKLTQLLEQISTFNQMSYEINRTMELSDIARAFTGRLYRGFNQINGVWIWLDRRRLDTPDAHDTRTESAPAVLQIAAQCGRDFGMPKELSQLRPDNPLAHACFLGKTVLVNRALREKAGALGWRWLADSPMTAFAGIPLRLGDTLLGVVGVFGKEEISPEFVRQLHLSVNQFAVALEKARLLRRLQKRAEELVAANEELRELDAMKDWFISSVSHELRTPLTSIRSFGEILENYDDLAPQERVEFARIIRQESERLSQMITELLDLAKIAQGQSGTEPAPFSLEPLLARCCRLFSQQAEERRIRLNCTVPGGAPSAFAEEMGVARVLNNLLGNAFKFTPDSGTIHIHVSQPHADVMLVRVTDTGVGVAAADQARIFEPFSQVADKLTTKTPGTGIGLAISKELVQNWGGSIWVESRPGQGSTFGFTVPAC